MTAATEAPPGADVSRETSQDRPLFVSPSAADKAPRRAESRPMAPDPDAPFGYMRDRATGEVRPRKTAGRQAAKRVQAPRKRPANRPRVAAAKPPETPATEQAPAIPAPSHADQVSEICGGVWMLTSALPTPAKPDRRILGVNVHSLVVRLKVQGHVISANQGALSRHVGSMADRIPQVARGVEWLTDENGWGWLIPCMFGLVGFVGQSQAAWQAPIEQLRPVAAQVDAQYAAFMQQQTALMAAAEQQAQQAAQSDVSRETSPEDV